MDPTAWIGQTIDGRYVVESVLGRGGMGTVLQARHAFTGQQVAVKVLNRELQLEPEIQQRFLAEAKAPNAIGHRSIVQVLDAGRTPEGMLYIAMELLVGRSLGVALRRGELSPELKKRVMLDLLESVGHAHAKGFVHRDLKPDNVFLTGRQNDVKLLDFGIAKVIDDVRKTATGALLGTPAYMAPEQLANAAGVDSRADLWAIGVMVYELMTGRLPIQGRNANEHLVALASAEPTPIRAYLPNASPEVEQFFARCLVRDPQQRFRDAASMLQALAPVSFAGGAAPVSTMATGHSPMGTVDATAGTMPPPQSYVHAPVAAVHHTTGPIPVAAPPKKALWIVAAIAIVFVIAGIVIAATRKSDSVAVADATPMDAAPPDVAVVEVANVPRTCDEKCDWLQTSCGTRFANCESDCKNLPAIWDPCYERSRVDCRDGAICGFEKVCGSELRGTGNCATALDCESKCTTTPACLCECAAKMSPRFALDLGRINACLSRAAALCLGKVGNDLQACVLGACGPEIQACKLAR